MYLKFHPSLITESCSADIQRHCICCCSVQVKVFIEGLISFNQDIPQFVEHLRDFIVQIREVSGEDNSDLYLEEREQTIQRAQMEKHRLRLNVPGIIGPYDLPEEMQD